MEPWLFDTIHRISEEIPAFKRQIACFIRNACRHEVEYYLPLIEDPKKREEITREFRLHADQTEQARQLERFVGMQQYLSSTRASFSLYCETKNWMLLSREIEKARKNLDDGLLWEPCSTELRELIVEFEKHLQKAKA